MMCENIGAQLLFRRLPLGWTVAYLPRGPVWREGEPAAVWTGASEAFWSEIDAACRRRRAVFLKVEPDSWESSGEHLLPPGCRKSLHSIQPPRTMVVSLQGDDEALLRRMKQKTRYNIRLASKKEVEVRLSADLEGFYRLMQSTGERDLFGVHSLAYYQRAYDLFHPKGECELWLAYYQQEPLGGLMAFAHGRRAWYFYGASSDDHRERMPAYLLQWHAMQWARARGCTEYDLWGIPDAEESDLEAQFQSRSDGLWGVYRFKRGFGGEVRRSAGPWDRVYQPLLYWLYLWRMRGHSVEGA